MSRVTGRLRPVELARTSRQPGMHCDGGGLYLSVAAPPSSACSWVFRYMLDKRARTMGLGPYPEITLAEARERAAEARRMKAHRQDPLELKRASKDAERVAVAKSMTFRQCAHAYIGDHRAGWKNAKTAAQWDASLSTYAYTVIGSLPVQSIDTGLVMKVLKTEIRDPGKGPEPLWTARPETASRIRGRMEVILDWAETNGHRDPGKNPARWKGHLDNNLTARSQVRAVEHHAALPFEEIADFMAILRGREAMAAKALELAILTAARTSEVLGARWDEVDLEKAVWTLPPERMKARRVHTVPLSAQAVKLLRGVKSDQLSAVFVFPSNKPGQALSNMSMLSLLKRMGRDDLTAHGFRSTFRMWAASHGIPRDLAEICLAHAVGDKVEAAYQRSDVLERRRPVMQAWAAFTEARAVGDNIRPLHKVDAA
jgi:integrase